MAIALFFAFSDITRSFSTDEAFSVWTIRDGITHLADAIGYDAHPPLYYLILGGWMKLGGSGEVWTRLFSGFCFLSGLAISIAWGVRPLGRSAALWTAGFQMLSIDAILGAHGVRFYALLGTLSTASLLLAVSLASETPSRPVARRQALLVVLNLAGLFTHYYFGFLLLSQLVGLVWLRRFRLSALVCLLPLVLFAVLWLPTLRFQLGLESSYWRLPPAISDLVRGYATHFDPKRTALIVVALLIALADRPTRTAVRAWLTSPNHRGRLLIPVCAVLCVLLPWMASQVKPLYTYQGLTIAIFPTAASIGLVAANTRWRYMWPVVFFLILAWTSTSVIKIERLHRDPARGDRATAATLLSHARPGDIVVLTNWVAFDYYLHDKPLTVINFPRDEAVHPGWYNEPAVLRHGTGGLRRDAIDLVDRVRHTWVAGTHPRLWFLDGDDSMFAPQTRAIARSIFAEQLRELPPIPAESMIDSPAYSCWRSYAAPQP